MSFLDPNKLQEDDELPGGSGLHLDLETKVCPSCHREALPWQMECQDCGVPTVVRADVPAPEFALPDLLLDGEADDDHDSPDGDPPGASSPDAHSPDAHSPDEGSPDVGDGRDGGPEQGVEPDAGR